LRRHVRFRSRYRTPLIVAAALLLVFAVLSLSLKPAPILKHAD